MSYSCDKVRDYLSPYMDGELDDKRARSVEEHLSQCRQCAEELEEMVRQEQLLKSVFHLPPLLKGPDPGLILQKVRHQPRIPLPWFTGLKERGYSYGIALTCLLVLFFFWWFLQRPLLPSEVRVIAKGGVVLQRKSSSFWTWIRPDIVRAGDLIINPSEALVDLRWGKGHQGRLAPGARIRINVEGQGGYLLLGKAWFKVKPSFSPFQVLAPGGKVEVLGTEFSVNVDSRGKTSVWVQQGRVRFSNSKGGVLLTNWTWSSALPNQAPLRPVPLNPLRPDALWWLRR